MAQVFPAHAGMFLTVGKLRHQRGCSGQDDRGWGARQVFPAHAGMFPEVQFHGLGFFRFPHARGDVPAKITPGQNGFLFSLRTRGCSDVNGKGDSPLTVFPAHAGMFRQPLGQYRRGAGFPRTRGDVPRSSLPSRLFLRFSPRTRGCSGG